MECQPVINIGMLGNVANGKSALVYALTGKTTQQFKDEIEGNKSIKLGYANCKIYKCECPDPECFHSSCNDIEELCFKCNKKMELKLHVSFVDCPGHDMLTTTMLNGTCIMDSAILVVNVQNSPIPEPQTRQHLSVSNFVDFESPLVVLNKIDLVEKQQALSQVEVLKNELKSTKFKNSPIIPTCATLKIGLNYICKYLVENLTVPEYIYNYESQSCEMIIIRTFNINKPDSKISELKGGVIGGSLIRGKLSTGDKVRLLPGIVYKKKDTKNTQFTYKPLNSCVTKIQSEKNILEYVVPGGLIACQLKIDPYFTVQDRLIGQIVVSINNNTFKVFEQIKVKFKKIVKTTNISVGEIVLVNCNGSNSMFMTLEKDTHKTKLITFSAIEKPICTKEGMKVSFSKKSDESRTQGSYKLIGFGIIYSGKEAILRD